EIMSAWNRNAIDGSFIWQTTLSKLLEKEGKVIITAGALAKEGALTADLGTVSEDFSATYPNFLTEFTDILDEATQRYREDSAAAAAIVAKEVSLTPEQSLAIMDELIWLDSSQQAAAQYMGTAAAPGDISKVLKSSADFMAEQGAIPPAPELGVFEQALHY
ncbi:MAG: taurine ABC transporter substrate-binding protein, partial [Cyanobacteria bacterium J06649_4]